MKHQQKSKPGSRATREEIIAEYLTGVYSYRELGAKHDIPHRSICDWVRESQGRKESWRDKTKRLNQLAKEHTPDVPKEVSLLQAEDAEIGNIKVLVVEDIALNQLLMKTLLDDFGFGREIAANGRIAIEKLQVKSYYLRFVDCGLCKDVVAYLLKIASYVVSVQPAPIPIGVSTGVCSLASFSACLAANHPRKKPGGRLCDLLTGFTNLPVRDSHSLEYLGIFDTCAHAGHTQCV